MRTFLILVVVLATTVPTALAEDFDYENAVFWWRGGFNEAWQTHDVIELVAAKRLGRSPFVHEYPFFSLLPFVQRNHPETLFGYNFRGLACAATLYGACVLDDRPVFDDKPSPGFWTYFLMAHNNTWKVRLSRIFRATLTTRSDITWLGYDEPDRGVMFTPRLGLELVGLSAGYEGDDPPPTNRLHVGVGRAYWLGFDGQRRDAGWTIVVGVAFLAGV
jgi:hypothetical protein